MKMLLAVLIFISMPAIASPPNYPMPDRYDMDFSDHDRTAHNAQIKGDLKIIESLCNQPQPKPAKGQVALVYHRNKSGACVGEIIKG